MKPYPGNYYGYFGGTLAKDNLGSFIVDETFKRIIESNNQKIQEKQCKLIADLNRSLRDIVNNFTKDVEELVDKLNAFTECKSKRKGNEKSK